MELDGVGVTQASPSRYVVRLKFGRPNYAAVELQRSEDAADLAKKLHELAAHVEARGK
ncbi:MAG TPA: hypothetical protein VLU47_10855 [Blastocatellia bacterium]|nr:hypothetical protein [Blastocatellia bacterium]